MNAPHRLQLQLRESRVEFTAERLELLTVVGHIYKPFVVGDFEHALPDLNTVRDGVGWHFSINGREMNCSRFDFALREIEDIIARCLLRARKDCLPLHAGAVLSATNQIVLVIGPSGSGKTTTSLELVRRGMSYLTDEFAAIDKATTCIFPFPRSATRKFAGPIPEGENLVIPQEQDYRSHYLPRNRTSLSPQDLSHCSLIFSRHDQTADPCVTPLSSAQVCARMMPSVFGFEGREQDHWPTISQLAPHATAIDFRFRDASTDLNLALRELGLAA
ncbi:MAG: hypothetical protein CL681_18185 [Blastopirellula sp.]|nr:hypothetical protein [Blastopirellula sp.]